jgi:hypothetical protein
MAQACGKKLVIFRKMMFLSLSALFFIIFFSHQGLAGVKSLPFPLLCHNVPQKIITQLSRRP